jgi:hypothetical protein
MGLVFEVSIPFQDPEDTLDFFEVCHTPSMLIEKELGENFETFGSYYPLRLKVGSLFLDLHHSQEVLLEVLLVFLKLYQKGEKGFKVPYFVQWNIQEPINFVLEFFLKADCFKIKHSLGYHEQGFWKALKLRHRYQGSLWVSCQEFQEEWTRLCHLFFRLLLKLYGVKNCIAQHFRFINTLMLWDAYQKASPLPFPVKERKYMELYEVIENYRGIRPTDEEELSPILEEMILKLYAPFLEPWLVDLGETGIFLGAPIISKKERLGTAEAQSIFFTFPEENRLQDLLKKK